MDIWNNKVDHNNEEPYPCDYSVFNVFIYAKEFGKGLKKFFITFDYCMFASKFY